MPFLAVAALATCTATCAATPDRQAGETTAVADPSTTPQPPPALPTETPTSQPVEPTGLGTDAKLYLTAPLRWDGGQWAWFGGALLAIGASHHYDADVRTHFAKLRGSPVVTSTDDAKDAVPTLVVLGGTWLYANLVDDSNGRLETWAMFEGAALSVVPVYLLKFAAGRASPNDTTNVNGWREVGVGSFPSYHATAAFAVGTVLAESGNDEYRWVRRLIGYGLGAGTAYERMKHNAHWLSDTVAGAALGIASAHFTMGRTSHSNEEAELRVTPLEGGVMLTYRVALP